MKRVTRRILFSGAAMLAFPRKSRATCCVNLSGPVEAYTPTFDPAGCAAGKRKPSYGGKATFITATDFLYLTSITDKAELYEWSGSGNHSLMATRNNSSDLHCGATTQVSVWTTASACICTSALQYFTKFYVTYQKCGNGFIQTDFDTSTVVQCP